MSYDGRVSKSFPGRVSTNDVNWSLRAASEFKLSSESKKHFAEVLRRCGSSRNFVEGKRVHSQLQVEGYDRYTYLGNLLVQMYGRCGGFADARAAFDKIIIRNVYSWTILMLAYVEHGLHRDALRVYREMRNDAQKIQPDDFIFSIALGACGALGADGLAEGREIRLHVVEERRSSSQIVSTALLDMYSKCGSVADAREVFDLMELRDVVAWGAIIAAYAGEGDGNSTLYMFRRMELEGVKPNAFIYSGVLDACSILGDFAEGHELHSRVSSSGLETHVVVATALVSMYSRSGKTQQARAVFDGVKSKDLVCWNSMLAGYSQQGCSDEALELFEEMLVAGSWSADSSTFCSMLHACSHGGLVERGRSCFMSMKLDHGVLPNFDHYLHMIDILGRAGRLEQAEELVEGMPFEPTSVLWITLLSSLSLHGRAERAERVADRVLELEPDNTAALVLVCNMYARLGRWKDVRRIRCAMRARGWRKLDESYSEVDNKLMLHCSQHDESLLHHAQHDVNILNMNKSEFV